MEMYPWRRICLSTGHIYTSAERPRSSSFTVCIEYLRFVILLALLDLFVPSKVLISLVTLGVFSPF